MRKKSTKKPPIPIELPYETAAVLRSLIHGAIGGDFTGNRARILLDKLNRELAVAGVPSADWDCFFVAHVEMSRAAKLRRKRV